MKFNILITVILMSMANAVLANAEKGLEIAKKIDATNSGWLNEQVVSQMILRSANGKEVVREIRTRSIEVAGDGDKGLVIFDKPGDVKGTVFLTYAHKKGNDDQWLYLPAIKRIKRISSSNRAGPFMGSELAYEDISSEEIERYTYHYLSDNKCGGGLDCFIFERYPVDENSGYSKQIVYADTMYFRIHKIEYFDRKGDHLKTLIRSNYKKIGGFWRATNWEMTNHLTKKSTSILWQNRKFGTDLVEGDFDKSAMKRYK